MGRLLGSRRLRLGYEQYRFPEISSPAPRLLRLWDRLPVTIQPDPAGGMPKRPSAVLNVPCYPMVEDRRAIVVKPRLAFWDWVNEHNQYSLAVRPKGNEGKVYLIADKDVWRWLDKHWLRVMEDEMATWCQNLDAWPERTRKQFEAWFTVEDHLVIYDTGSKGLRKEHYPPRVVGSNELKYESVMPVSDGA